MTRASQPHVDRARQVLSLERASAADAEGEASSWATAACRTYDKLHLHLDPLLGAAGVEALLVRSATLARAGRPSAGASAVAVSHEGLRRRLQALEPESAAEDAAALFAAFFALITTFIGERLTHQLLRNAWPTLEESDAKETGK